MLMLMRVMVVVVIMIIVMVMVIRWWDKVKCSFAVNSDGSTACRHTLPYNYSDSSLKWAGEFRFWGEWSRRRPVETGIVWRWWWLMTHLRRDTEPARLESRSDCSVVEVDSQEKWFIIAQVRTVLSPEVTEGCIMRRLCSSARTAALDSRGLRFISVPEDRLYWGSVRLYLGTQ